MSAPRKRAPTNPSGPFDFTRLRIATISWPCASGRPGYRGDPRVQMASEPAGRENQGPAEPLGGPGGGHIPRPDRACAALDAAAYPGTASQDRLHGPLSAAHALPRGGPGQHWRAVAATTCGVVADALRR